MRQYKVIKKAISAELLVNLFREGTKEARIVKNPLPKDAELIKIGFNIDTGQTELYFISKERGVELQEGQGFDSVGTESIQLIKIDVIERAKVKAALDKLTEWTPDIYGSPEQKILSSTDCNKLKGELGLE